MRDKKVKKIESSEETPIEYEEGKQSSVSDMLFQSPNLRKKSMDFGSSSKQAVWCLTYDKGPITNAI